METHDDPLKECWKLPSDKVLNILDVEREKGLEKTEVARRKHEFGPNKLKKAERKPAGEILIDQFKSILVLLLTVAAGVSFVFMQWVEGIAIAVVIVINAVIGFYTEYRALKSMEALYALTEITDQVRREGTAETVSAEDIVPGDIVLLEAGDLVTADIRLIEASNLQVDESSLTGESIPVSKQVESIEEDLPLADRRNMLYKGTALTRGSAEGVVIATGMDTELGKISSLVEEAQKGEKTPLEKRLETLGQKLVWVALAIAGVVAVSGVLQGRDTFQMIETAIALAVATVPEGLPIVATIALARGMWKMADQNALVNRLSAVETLGSTSVICTDKTGTLTENKMTVTDIVIDEGRVSVTGTGLELEGTFTFKGQEIDPHTHTALHEILLNGVLCTNASLTRADEIQAVGDPTEVALLVAGEKAGIERDTALTTHPEMREESFDPAVKMMATVHEADDHYVIAAKGAPEAVLEASTHVSTDKGERELTEKEKSRWRHRDEKLASEGLRVLAMAKKYTEVVDADPYSNLTFIGLIGLLDPPRREVRPSIETCQEAGIRVVMVTGDHAATAVTVGRELGLIEESEVVEGQVLEEIATLTEEEREKILQTPIFARVNPAQKLNLIEIHQAAGSIVAMTGDGVNDAPALNKADIGVAMGQRGTQVARESADIILRDDNFSTIEMAVEQGRVIFTNIRKFVFYLLSCNISEILVIFLASLMGVPLPLLPLQILFLNVVTDIFPAFALSGGKGSPRIMKIPPRDPKESILTRNHWEGIGAYGLTITAAVLGAFSMALFWYGMPETQVVTVSFLTLAFSQLWHVFNMRDRGSSFLNNEITENPYVWGALLFCGILLLLATYLPGLSAVLKTVDPGHTGWMLILGFSLLPWAVGQLWNSLVSQIS
jgi:Ca2+-transporting ATPase